ncbi:G-protein coupled receptor Git3 [Schizosaccharomyces pombe]|uniref:Glucose receptor protein git3 n=1 Tax=Schizosaccharomyces pombe (strain 972 / ATCC 24843) TaxID=284812 RepID=GIT3_SCHPO|nr:G-protein-coupled receptor Git3 [Schizosaccharomyces pombe]O94744.1 RecName: Full=Glucose receptor protein git3; AltName: Full=Glucose-insensitive transcription protein 3 [Schizosaccharomyces pombe 972h-]AAC69337.1 git3p [Schizosaccharomyces pombe]CAA22776.1 G-protein coupled receptor Git3 [Schizosaccharomyces pombe]|eukprot:NP_588228.1 G-protein-coupled receptor Git3 [Schizosaccharomyces pombe]
MLHLDYTFNVSDATSTSSIIIVSRRELANLRIMVIIASAISIVFSLIAIFWRWSRRRTIREQFHIALFSVLFIRSIVQMIHPCLALSDPFFWAPKHRCFTIGFFLLVLVRMTDYWIFINILHNALLVLFPHVDTERRGLYRFRHTVFTLSFVIPLTIGGLAFTNKRNTFVNLQTRCYLPYTPVRFMFGLNWSFDYALSIAIIALQTCMFISIRRKIKRFKKYSHQQTNVFDTLNVIDSYPTAPDQVALPPFPDTNSTLTYTPSNSQSIYSSQSQPSPYSRPLLSSVHPNLPPGSQSTPANLNQSGIHFEQDFRDSPNRTNGLEDHTSFKLSSPLTSDEDGASSVLAAYGNDMQDDPLLKQRKRILSQSKFLFAYPAIFIFMWILPQIQIIVILAQPLHCSGSCKRFAFVAVFADNFVAIFIALSDFIWICYRGYTYLKERDSSKSYWDQIKELTLKWWRGKFGEEK